MTNRPYRIPYSKAKTSKSAQDILNKADERDEPVFIIRAKDIFALPTLNYYIAQVKNYGPSSPDFLQELHSIREAMKSWRDDNVERVHYPD